MSRRALEAYRQALGAGDRMREDAFAFDDISELEWQARWFAGDFGSEWKSVDGEMIRIEDFGRWNREPGPDFVGARIRIGARELRGAVELDMDVRDWERHAHAINPAFRETILHVFTRCPSRRFFTRTCDHREIAQLLLPATCGNRGRRQQGAPGLIVESGGASAILQAAARHRLDLKAGALRRHAAVRGESAAWFSALAEALGYKNNQVPFVLLAQRADLRDVQGQKGAALLFGLAGFLESPTPPLADRATRDYLRTLWENWWAMRASCERLILPGTAWRTAGVRPANHPHRRVAALSRIAANWQPISEALSVPSRDAFVAALESLEHSFWNTRFNLQAAALKHPQALIGEERIRDILINIFHPLAVERDDSAWTAYLAEKGPAPAAILRAAAQRFFGAAATARGFLSSAVAQQGLLQLERDYRAAAEPGEFLAALRRIPAGSTASGQAC